MQEKRTQLRGQTGDILPVSDRESGAQLGRVSNMSIEGLQLISDCAIEQDQELHLKISVSNNQDNHNYAEFDAEVRWCKRNDRTGKYDIGLKFTKIEDTDRQIVIKLLGQCTVAPPSF